MTNSKIADHDGLAAKAAAYYHLLSISFPYVLNNVSTRSYHYINDRYLALSLY